MKFNAGKTQIVVLQEADNRANSNLVVDFNGCQITPESSARFLGITIRDDLIWDKYILEDKTENGTAT